MNSPALCDFLNASAAVDEVSMGRILENECLAVLHEETVLCAWAAWFGGDWGGLVAELRQRAGVVCFEGIGSQQSGSEGGVASIVRVERMSEEAKRVVAEWCSNKGKECVGAMSLVERLGVLEEEDRVRTEGHEGKDKRKASKRSKKSQHHHHQHHQVLHRTGRHQVVVKPEAKQQFAVRSDSSIYCLALGNVFAITGTMDGTVRVYNLLTHKKEKRPPGEGPNVELTNEWETEIHVDGTVMSLAYRESTRTVFIGCDDGQLWVWQWWGGHKKPRGLNKIDALCADRMLMGILVIEPSNILAVTCVRDDIGDGVWLDGVWLANLDTLEMINFLEK